MAEHPFVTEIPGVNGGYPVIRGSSIPVRIIVQFFRRGLDLDQLMEMYPHIGRERLQGALDYYAAYPARVDEDIERNARAWAEHHGLPWPA
jgi:uncharacterized protein (DUF433 family)